jgi:hypothetical protein
MRFFVAAEHVCSPTLYRLEDCLHNHPLQRAEAETALSRPLDDGHQPDNERPSQGRAQPREVLAQMGY